jgi:hypothetical protein
MTVCHLHCAKSEEHNNNDDINSSDCENSYVPIVSLFQMRN